MPDNNQEIGILIKAQEQTQSAFDKATAQLGGLGKDAASASAALKRVADSFSGSKILEEAEAATRYITQLGGATALTEKEQGRLNSQITEAVAKYQALGLKAPADMKALADATAGANRSTTDILGTVGKFAGAVGIGFSVGAVINFGKSVFDTASQIHDMAEQLGISAEATQGFKFAAEQAGSSIETVGTSLTKMNKNLAEGDKSTITALKDAGLSFQEIRNMKPEDAFLAITDAIAKIPDPMKQVQVGTAIMGKGFAELLPAIKEGFRSASDAADKMSNDTVNRLEAAEDAWTKLGNKVTIVTGEMIASVAKATSSWKDFATFVFNHSMGADHPILQTPDINLPAPPPKPVDHKTKEEIEEAEKAAKKYAEAVKELKDAITPLTAAQQASAIALDQQGASAEQIAKVLKVSGTAVSKFLADLQNSGKDSLDDWAEIVRRHQEEQRDGEAATLAEIERLRQDELAVSTADLDDWSEVVKHHQEEQRKGEEATLAALKKNASESAKVLGDLSTALSQLAQVSGGAFGAVVSGLSQIVLSANAAEKAIAAMKSGMAKDADGKGKGLEGILEMSTGILGIVSAAMQAFNAVKSLFGLFDRSKGRDLVESFAETMGGFDALHQQLLTLGDEGEALWIKLTQGVGRNNPQQAQAAIDEVTKALDKQKEKQDQVGTVTEEAAIATIETATQASEALKTVGEQLETNKGQWSDWADSVMSDIARVAASVGAVMVPEPPDSAAVPGFAGGTHGAFLDFGAGTPVMLHGRERVVTEQEGRLGGGDVHVYIGNEQLDSRMVRVARKDAATGGLRTRATTGRSY